MEVCLLAFLFLGRKIMAYSGNETTEPNLPFTFVAGIVDVDTSNIIATGAVISPHWVLTAAHLFPEDTTGINANKYFIIVGLAPNRYYPTFALTHPTYTWGLYTAEDLALFFIDEPIETKPVLISGNRFPWNSIQCSFIYWNETKFPYLTRRSLKHFANEITVIQNCLTKKQKVPIGLLQFYLNDILCGTAYSLPHCVGDTGGILYCENLLVGILIRKSWCENKTANFTDIGAYFNWLYSRVDDGMFVRLTTSSCSSAMSVRTLFGCCTLLVAYKII